MSLQSWCPRSELMIAVAQGRRRRGEARESVVPAGRELLARLVRGFVGWGSRSLRSGKKQVSVSPTGCRLLTDIVRACPCWDNGPYLVEARYNGAEQERPCRAVRGGHMSVRKPWRLRSRGAIATAQAHARLDDSLVHGTASCEGAQGLIVGFHLHGGCQLEASSKPSWSGDVT